MQLEMPSMFTTFFSAYNGGIERGRVSLNEHALGLYGTFIATHAQAHWERAYDLRSTSVRVEDSHRLEGIV